jgi:hypothetical protein
MEMKEGSEEQEEKRKRESRIVDADRIIDLEKN